MALSNLEIIVRQILMHNVFWPCIQCARQNFKCESIGKYLFQGKVRWLFQEPALLFSIFRGLLEQLLLWASSKLEICQLQSQLLLTDTAKCRFHKQLWQVLCENKVKILWINLEFDSTCKAVKENELVFWIFKKFILDSLMEWVQVYDSSSCFFYIFHYIQTNGELNRKVDFLMM